MDHTGLSRDWVVQPAIDLELKRYILLAYLQRVKRRFEERKLYPYLDDLRTHWRSLKDLHHTKEQLTRRIPGELIGFDPRTGAAIHERPEEDAVLDVIGNVIGHALPVIGEVLAEGTDLQGEISKRIQFSPIGLLPLDTREGWLLLKVGSDARVYSYCVPLVRPSSEGPEHGTMRTRFVTTYTMSITCTYEHIKADLIEANRAWPNPATFAFETDLSLPYIETYIPLAKQLIMAHVAPAH